MLKRKILFTVAASVFLGMSTLVQATEGKLVVVISYPPDTTTTFKKAFEKKYPGIKVEMLKKKTTAGVNIFRKQPATTHPICSGHRLRMRSRYSRGMISCRNTRRK
ncbi:hypothetical protein [Thiolapillus sp.]|uniref:hypothetical protein n=1 Tax=Thiolapillus sp. TaxID=2017437 RepID=UPI003AF9A8C6